MLHYTTTWRGASRQSLDEDEDPLSLEEDPLSLEEDEVSLEVLGSDGLESYLADGVE